MKKMIMAVLVLGGLFVISMFFVMKGLHGKSGYKEGTDKKVITNRFSELPEFSDVFYAINIISAGGVGTATLDGEEFSCPK